VTGRINSGRASPAVAGADLGAFLRQRADVPVACGAALIGTLSQLRGSDDPAVTFGRLPGACVPEFADGCEVELSDGAQPAFRVRHPVGSDADPEPATAHNVEPEQVLSTPFTATSAIGYPSYAGVVTHWWASRTPSECDAVIADLMVKHLVSLVDHERLMAAVARAEDRAAGLALQAISGRTVALAIGIVMRANGLAAAEAEDLLRQSAGITGRCLHELAVGVVRSRSL
jgi:hypothetical protein